MATDLKLLNIINKIPMFHELSVDEAQVVLRICEQKNYDPEEVIFKYGEISREMLILMSGKLRVSAPHGDIDLNIAEINPGQLVGEMSALTGRKRSVTIVSSEKSIALSLKTADFDILISRYHDIGVKILRNVINDLSEKIRISNSRLFT